MLNALRVQLGVSNRSPNHTFRRVRRLVNGSDDGAGQYAQRLRISKSVEDFVDFMDGLTDDADARIWIEKTPGHFAYLDEIKRLLPAAKFLQIVRDPVANIASLHYAAIRHPESPAWQHFIEIECCIQIWKKSAAVALEAAEQSFFQLVDYRQLVHQTQGVLSSAFEHLGVPDVELDGLLERRGNIAHQVIREEESWKSTVFEAVREPVDRSDCLSKKQIRTIEMQCEEMWCQVEQKFPSF